MSSNEFKIRDAEGTVLFDEITVNGRSFPKGHKLSADDIKFLNEAGIKHISALKAGEGETGFDLALGIVGTKLAGADVAYILDNRGILKFAALRDGIFMASEERIAKFNRMSEVFILNTIVPYSAVKEGDVIARLEMVPPQLPQEEIDAISMKLSGNLPLLSIVPNRPRKTALIYSRFYNTAKETAHFTRQVKKLVKKFANFNLDFSGEYYADHSAEAVADAVEQAVGAGFELIFVIPGLRSATENDTIPLAVKSFADEFIACRVAEINASDMYLGEKRGSRIICLPYNYDAVTSGIIDEMILRVMVNDKLLPSDFAWPHNIPLSAHEQLDDSEKLMLQSHAGTAPAKNKARIAVVILAAGTSTRTKRNKLLVPSAGEMPLFMNSIRAAIASEGSPVFVITGYQHEELEEYLDGLDINIVYNPAYRQGIKTSINLGLKLVPSQCDGAILLPADMPNITVGHLNKLIAAFKKNKARQVIITAFHGVKHNPLLWSRELFDVADLVPENAAIRSVFMEHEDYTTLINAGNEKLILDVNYPVDVESVEKN